MKCKICEHKINLIASFTNPQKNEKIFTSLKKFKKKKFIIVENVGIILLIVIIIN